MRAASQIECVDEFDPYSLYKFVSGLNAIKLRRILEHFQTRLALVALLGVRLFADEVPARAAVRAREQAEGRRDVETRGLGRIDGQALADVTALLTVVARSRGVIAGGDLPPFGRDTASANAQRPSASTP